MPELFMLSHAPIRVNTRNEWLHGDDPINPKVAKLFAEHVTVTIDGSYAVHVGQDTQPISVEDTPFYVTSMVMEAQDPGPDASGLARVLLTLSDGTTEALDPTTLMQSADNALYCRIVRHGHAVPCRFTPQQYHALAMHAEGGEAGYALHIGGRRYAFRPYDRRPRRQVDD